MNEPLWQSPTHRCKVLIAEDNPANMLVAKITIKRIAPYVTVVGARNGLEAYQHCREECPDLVFMDIHMPLMNGFDATKKILGLPHCTGLPIIALSAGDAPGERGKCIDSGMVDFLAKPIVKDNLRAAFYRWAKRENPFMAVTNPGAPVQRIRGHDPEHLNVEKIKECVGDDPMAVKEILELTLTELYGVFPRFTFLIGQKDLRGLREAGHKLKGACMTAGLDGLLGISKAFADLEGFQEEEIYTLRDDLFRENTLVIGCINGFIEQNPSPPGP